MGAMNDSEQEEEVELDFKSPEESAQKENELLAELRIAKELGMTLGQLRREMTYEELWLWVAYFGLEQDQAEERMNKAKRRR